MSLASGSGTVATFYSWKGGVGRTLALANVAVQLARAGRSVLMIDWDLEAPGLDRYFVTPGSREASLISTQPANIPGGLLSLLTAAMERGDGSLTPTEWRSSLVSVQVPKAETTFRTPYAPTPGRLDLLSAGDGGAAYAERLSEFSWGRFFADARGGEWLEQARAQWSQAYDFVLIDSRTGLTDAGGICTIQLPDVLVLVFAANDQSFVGGMRVVDAAQHARKDYGHDRGLLTVVPLLSRWCGDEEVDIAESWMARFDRELRPLVASWLPEAISPRWFLEQYRVPHVARFTFGEPLPVLTHSVTDPALPGLAFDRLAKLLASDINVALVTESVAPAAGANVALAPPVLVANLDLAALHQALKRTAEAHGNQSVELAETLRSAGRALFSAARYSDAEPLLRQALQIDEINGVTRQLDIATDLSLLAGILQATNRLAEAELAMRRALDINQSTFGSNHPRIASDLSNLGLLLQNTGRIADAEIMFRRALSIREAGDHPKDPQFPARLNNLAGLLLRSNRASEAEPLIRQALALDEAMFGQQHPNVARDLTNLARLLLQNGQHDEVEQLLRRALAINETAFGESHPSVGDILRVLADAMTDAGRISEALPLLRRALNIDTASYGAEHPRTVETRNCVSRVLARFQPVTDTTLPEPAT